MVKKTTNAMRNQEDQNPLFLKKSVPMVPCGNSLALSAAATFIFYFHFLFRLFYDSLPTFMPPTPIRITMTTSTFLLPLILLASHDPPTVQSFQPPSPLTSLLPLSSPRTLFPSTVSSTTSPSSATTTTLPALSQRQSFLLDGGELESFLLYNPSPQQQSSSTTMAEKVFRSPRNSPRGIGCLTFVTGTTEQDPEGDGAAKSNTTRRRIIGVEATPDDAGESTDSSSFKTISLGNNIRVYEHTAATIPENISDWDAISTAAAAVVGVHCAVPRVGGVGGSEVEFTSGKVSEWALR